MFTEREYAEMDRGHLLMWLSQLEAGSAPGKAPARALLALERLGGLMGEW